MGRFASVCVPVGDCSGSQKRPAQALSLRPAKSFVLIVNMARRKKTQSAPRTKVTKKPGGVVVVSQSAPLARAKSVGRRIAKAAGGASLQSRMQGAFIAGAVLGFVERTFGDKIPNLPIVGRKGAVSLAVYFMKPKHKILQDVGVTAAGLSGYQLGKENKIDGDDDFVTT